MSLGGEGVALSLEEVAQHAREVLIIGAVVLFDYFLKVKEKQSRVVAIIL